MERERSEIRQDIASATARLARRINTYAFWRLISVSMLWGTGFAVVFILIGKFLSVSVPKIIIVAAILGVSLTVGIIRGMLARISSLEAAIIADAQLGLKERLSSAVELLGEKNKSAMAELQLEDAADYARSLDPKAICPRVFPITAWFLPLALLCLIIIIYGLWYYDQNRIPAEIRQTVNQAGDEIEALARETDKDSLSKEVAKLHNEMEATGREFQDEPLTKKEVLKNLSNLARRTEAMKLIGEITEELRSEMTPEKKRLLSELLEKLADRLRDIQGMEGLSRKILKAQQANLSVETLRELSAAMDQMKIRASDMEALQQMSEQLAKSKRDIGQMNLATIRRGNSAGIQIEGEPGHKGSGPPGKKSVKDSERVTADASRSIPTDAGYDSELDGQLSDDGRSVSTKIEADAEKGKSVVPYQDIYVKYRDAADDAIARSVIPWTYREHVKNYFDAIKPKEE